MIPPSNNRIHFLLLGLILVTYMIGWNIHVMEIDAAQYAALSMEMLQSGNFLEVHLKSQNYLDKPPLTFWMVALSFKLFGINDISYRIPNFLFTLLAFLSTFRFAKLYYSDKTAWLAVLILGSTQAFFLMNHDCRTDTVLTGAVAYAVWQLATYLKFKRWKNLLGAGIGIGLSLLSKGPIGLVIPILAFGPQLLLQRDFKSIFDWKWVVLLLVAAIVISPMCYGLYKQYGSYGLRFYFWIQSFGRITGESTWDNNTDMSFLLQNHLWSFAPFTIFFFPAIYFFAKKIIINKFKLSSNEESITLFGFILPFISFSTSHYQLPHYIFVLYPFAAIFTADYIIHGYQNLKNKSGILILNFVVLFAFVLLIGILTLYCFRDNIALNVIYFAFFTIVVLVFILKYRNDMKAIFFTILVYTLVNIGLNGLVYPSLLRYQTGSEAAFSALKVGVKGNKLISFMTDGGFAMDFYLHSLVKQVTDLEYPVQNNLAGYYIYTNETGKQKLVDSGYTLKTIYSGEDYHVTTLTPKFLNPKTRKETVEMKYLYLLEKR